MKFRKKSVVIEAIQYTGSDTWQDVLDFAVGSIASVGRPGEPILISTLEGGLNANVGDWIIKGIKGEFYPCKPDIFEQTYEKVED